MKPYLLAMEGHEIENIEIRRLQQGDHHAVKEAMIAAYPSMPGLYWKESHMQKLMDIFPDGQVVIEIDGKLAGCALSIIVHESLISSTHTYREATGNFTFSTHDPEGEVLYGIEIFIKPGYRGLRLGRRLYDYRKELC